MPTLEAVSSSREWPVPAKGNQGATALSFSTATKAELSSSMALPKANISDEEKEAFKQAAQHILSLSDAHLTAMIEKGQFSEVHDHD